MAGSFPISPTKTISKALKVFLFLLQYISLSELLKFEMNHLDSTLLLQRATYERFSISDLYVVGIIIIIAMNLPCVT
jgi:hypothetical protein